MAYRPQIIRLHRRRPEPPVPPRGESARPAAAAPATAPIPAPAPARLRMVALPPPAPRLGRSIADLIPTPLTPRGRQAAIPIAGETPRRFRGLQVVGRFAGFFAVTAARKLTRRWTANDSAVRLRRVFEDLGGMWIKLGQLLSLRSDTFSPELCRELSQLQFQASGFSPDLAIAVIEEEFGRPLNRVFAEFEPQPFAAASICQVHRGILRDGDVAVAVKVQRPGIRQDFDADLRLLKRIVGVLHVLGMARHMHLDDAMWELNEIMREETDYLYEASNLKRMRKILKDHDILVPRVFQEHCSRRVLVMEFMPGVLMSEFIRAKLERPAEAEDWLLRNDIEPRKVAKRLLLSVLRQIMEDNTFHADLHPGNIMLLRDSRIALIDFGTIGTLEPEFLDMYKLTVMAIAQRNFAKAADYLMCLCPDIPVVNVDQVRKELVRAYRVWEARTHLAGLPYFERAVSAASTEAGRILSRYNIHASWDMLRVGRTFATLDASLYHLVPDANFLKLYAAYFKEVRRRHGGMRGTLRRLGSGLGTAAMMAAEANAILSPQMRKHALRMRGFAGTASRIWSTVLSALRIGTLISAVALTVSWISHHHHDLLPSQMHGYLDHVRDAAPRLPYLQWITLIALALFAAYVLKRVARMLRREE